MDSSVLEVGGRPLSLERELPKLTDLQRICHLHVSQAIAVQQYIVRWLAAPLSSRSTTEPRLGFVIEKHIHSVLHYWTGHGIGKTMSWSPKHEDAIRFARAEDGAIVLSWCMDGDGNVVQHSWSMLPAAPSSPSGAKGTTKI